MLVPNQASHIKKPLDPAFSLLKQDHKLLGFPVLSFEATWLEDVLQGFNCCKLESLVLANVIPVEAREHIILSKFVAVSGKQIVLQITFLGSHLPIDYWLGLRQRFSKWSFFIYNPIRYWGPTICGLLWRFVYWCIIFKSIRLWFNDLHLWQVILVLDAGELFKARVDQVLDPWKIRGVGRNEWLSWFYSHQ